MIDTAANRFMRPCRGCHTVDYCSVDCQVKDRKSHRASCGNVLIGWCYVRSSEGVEKLSKREGKKEKGAKDDWVLVDLLEALPDMHVD